MERKTTSTTIRHTQNGDITTKTTRITQESRLDRSRRIASQNSTLFRFALSGTIVVLFFGLFLLIDTTDYYNNNVQELNWVDENGQFIENSYNLQVSITNDTPLNDLNDLTLNEFFDYNVILNGDFSQGSNYWQFHNSSIVNSMAYVGNNPADAFIRPLSYIFPYTNDGNIYFIAWAQSFVSYGGNRLFNFILFLNDGIQTYKGEILGTPIFDNQGTSQYFIDDVIAINLTSLGLTNLTNERITEYYNIYLQNKYYRSLNFYNNLGNIPVTNLENMNAVLFKPAVDIVNTMTNTASSAAGITIGAWQFVINIWNRIWGVE